MKPRAPAITSVRTKGSGMSWPNIIIRRSGNLSRKLLNSPLAGYCFSCSSITDCSISNISAGFLANSSAQELLGCVQATILWLSWSEITRIKPSTYIAWFAIRKILILSVFVADETLDKVWTEFSMVLLAIYGEYLISKVMQIPLSETENTVSLCRLFLFSL